MEQLKGPLITIARTMREENIALLNELKRQKNQSRELAVKNNEDTWCDPASTFSPTNPTITREPRNRPPIFKKQPVQIEPIVSRLKKVIFLLSFLKNFEF